MVSPFPPPGVVGCPSDQWVLLASGSGIAVTLDCFVCYADGFEFRMAIRSRGTPPASSVNQYVIPELTALRCLVVTARGSADGANTYDYQPWPVELRGFHATELEANVQLCCRLPAPGDSLEMQVGPQVLGVIGQPHALDIEELRDRGARSFPVD